MANGKIRFGKQSGGELALVIPDGVTNTEVVVPESGILATKQYVDDATNRIGLIYYGYVAKSYHIVAFGGEFNRADYPKLWEYIQVTPGVLATEAYWQSEAAAQGGICGVFSAGNGTTTFRVPNLNNAFLRPTIRAVGSYQADAFKNHTHDIIAPTSIAAGAGSSGIILASTGSPNYSTTPSGGTETRPINIAVLPLIVAK